MSDEENMELKFCSKKNVNDYIRYFKLNIEYWFTDYRFGVKNF